MGLGGHRSAADPRVEQHPDMQQRPHRMRVGSVRHIRSPLANGWSVSCFVYCFVFLLFLLFPLRPHTRFTRCGDVVGTSGIRSGLHIVAMSPTCAG